MLYVNALGDQEHRQGAQKDGLSAGEPQKTGLYITKIFKY